MNKTPFRQTIICSRRLLSQPVGTDLKPASKNEKNSIFYTIKLTCCLVLIFGWCLAPATGFAQSEHQGELNQQIEDALLVNPKVSLKTNKGKIVVELYLHAASKTIALFLENIKKGYYNNLVFNRFVTGYAIQLASPKKK